MVEGGQGTGKHELLGELAWAVEDVQYHIYVLEKIHRGEDHAEKEGTLSQDEVEKRLSKWISK
jgi:hypothetical protein